MAINVIQIKPLSRSKGQSAIAAAAYRSGENIFDQREGREHDYRRKTGIDQNASQIIQPDGVDSPIAKTRSALWNAAEKIEKRKDARIAREYIIALPKEASSSERQQLAEQFGQYLANRYQVAVDLNIHAPHRASDGDNSNHHAHLLTTTRQLSADGLGAKSAIELSDSDRAKLGLLKGKDELFALREAWTDLQNQVLARYDTSVTALSLADQGKDQRPTVHMGARDTALERKGIASASGNLNRKIIEENNQKQNDMLELDRLKNQEYFENHALRMLEQERQRRQEYEKRIRTPLEAVQTTKPYQPTRSLLDTPQKRLESPEKAYMDMTEHEVVEEWIKTSEFYRVMLYRQRLAELEPVFKKSFDEYQHLKENKPLIFGKKDWETSVLAQKHRTQELHDRLRDHRTAIELDGVKSTQRTGTDFQNYLGNSQEKSRDRNLVYDAIETHYPTLSKRFSQIPQVQLNRITQQYRDRHLANQPNLDSLPKSKTPASKTTRDWSSDFEI